MAQNTFLDVKNLLSGLFGNGNNQDNESSYQSQFYSTNANTVAQPTDIDYHLAGLDTTNTQPPVIPQKPKKSKNDNNRQSNQSPENNYQQANSPIPYDIQAIKQDLLGNNGQGNNYSYQTTEIERLNEQKLQQLKSDNRTLTIKHQSIQNQVEQLERRIENQQKWAGGQKKEVRKPCDHAQQIHELQLYQQSKENQYKHLHGILHDDLKQMDKEIQTAVAQQRQLKVSIEGAKKIKSQVNDNSIAHVEKLNEVKFLFKTVTQQNADLANEVKALQRICSEQTTELEQIEEKKGYAQKLDELVKELDGVYARNKAMNETILAGQSLIRDYKSKNADKGKRQFLAEMSVEELQNLIADTKDDIEHIKVQNMRQGEAVKSQMAYGTIQ